MNLDAFYAAHRVDGRSRPPYDPAMMAALLLYAYARDSGPRHDQRHDEGRHPPLPGSPMSYAPARGRALTAVAHERGHGLGLPHAGLRCGGNSNGQVGSAWPPDDEAALRRSDSTRASRRPTRYAGTTQPPPSGTSCPTAAQAKPTTGCPSAAGTTCGTTSHRVKSCRARATARRASAAAARARVRALGVTTFVDDTGEVTIRGLTRVTMPPTPSLPGSSWHVVVRDAEDACCRTPASRSRRSLTLTARCLRRRCPRTAPRASMSSRTAPS